MSHFTIRYGLFLLVTFSCHDETISPDFRNNKDSNTEKSYSQPNEYNLLLSHFAKHLAKALENKDLRVAIKTEAIKKFDGDYDILFHSFQHKLLAGGVFVQSLLDSSISRSNTVLGRSENAFSLERLENSYPNLQISVPVNIEKWNTEKYIPLVAVLPDDYEDGVDKYINAYNPKGEFVLLDVTNEPIFPVIVVGRSERVSIEQVLRIGNNQIVKRVPRNQYLPTFESDVDNSSIPIIMSIVPTSTRQLFEVNWTTEQEADYFQLIRMRPGETEFKWIADIPMHINSHSVWIGPEMKHAFKIRAVRDSVPGGWSPTFSFFGSDRLNGDALKLKSLKLSSETLKNIESWPLGAPEIFIQMAMGNSISAELIYASGKLEPNSRSAIKNKWWDVNLTLLESWSLSDYQNSLRINFTERDYSSGSTSLEIAVPYESSELNEFGGTNALIYWRSQKHQEFAEESIFWWQSSNKVYDQNGFSWQFSTE